MDTKQTSLEALASNQSVSATQRDSVVIELACGDDTRDGLVVRTGLGTQSLTPRVHELINREGYVYETGETRQTRSGKAAAVCALTEDGWTRAEEILDIQ